MFNSMSLSHSYTHFYIIIVQDDRDDTDGGDGMEEKDCGEMVEVDATETIEQTDPVYDYHLDIDCNEMPITIDELSMGVSQHADICMETGKLARFTNV